MAEAFRRASIGCLDLSASAEVTPDVRVGGAGPLEHAAYGTSLELFELIKLMITESDNTATNILIKILGMDAVNNLAHTLGCHDTLLERHMMDFTARAAGRDNFTSPADMNILLSRLYAKDCIDPASDQTMLAILLRQTDKCKLPLLLPPGTVIAHKTGELDGIEHDSGIIYGKTPYILTIMTENLPDEEQGRQTIAELSRIVYDALQ
jgi:beta-lactamase class A